MAITLANRAEIALRSLPTAERKKVLQALEVLGKHGLGKLSAKRVHRLTGSAEGLYSLRASPLLRVVFSHRGDEYVVEDIATGDRVDRLQLKGTRA